MRLVKPLRLSLLHRVFENAGQPMLTVTSFVTFRLDAPRAIQHEVSLWKAVGKTMPDGVLDEFLPKPRGEVLVSGSAFVVGEPSAATMVKIEVQRDGKKLVEKELAVFGDRSWSTLGMTAPKPFTEMPITWDRAFGGEGFADNPKGRGYRATEVDGAKAHLLPNIENPRKLLVQPSDRPVPATFSPLDLTAPSRMKRAGTYDQRWLDTRFPYYPEDFDWEFFNVALEDQRIEGFFLGGETFRVEGMNAERRVIEGALPPVLARVFVEKKAQPDVLAEVPMHIDTLLFFPNMLLGVIAFRGTVPCAEDDAEDVRTLIGGIDDAAAPRSQAHYESVFQLRQSKSGAHLELLNDAPLVPDWFVEPDQIEEGWNDMAEHTKLEFHARKRAEAKRDELVAETRQKLIAGGLTEEQAMKQAPDLDFSASDLGQMNLSNLPNIIDQTKKRIEESKERLERERDEHEQQMRELLAEHGRDRDAERHAALKKAAGPPIRMSAQIAVLRIEVEKSQEQGGGDLSGYLLQLEEMSKRMSVLEPMQFESYRRFRAQQPGRPRPARRGGVARAGQRGAG